MEVKYPFLLFLYPALLALMLLFYKFLYKKNSSLPSSGISRSKELTQIPAYKKRIRRSKYFRLLSILSLIVMTLGLTVVSARPVTVSTNPNTQKGLDVMIVLDASGSMTDYFQNVGRGVRSIVEQFKTDRLGFVVFSGESQTVLPLTDDYTEILSIADFLRDKHPADFKYRYGYGVRGGTDIASGLNLASARMSNLSTERTKVILLISDGEQTGSTEDEADLNVNTDYVTSAANNLAQKNIKIYSLATPGDGAALGSDSGKELLQELADISSGAVYNLDNPEATQDVFQEINKLLRSSVDSGDVTTTYETPALWLYVSLVGLLSFLITSAFRIDGGLV